MKIRNSFISNSSSSSYVLITSLENHEQAMNRLNSIQRELIERVYMSKQDKFMDTQCIVLTDWGDPGGGGPAEEFHEFDETIFDGTSQEKDIQDMIEEEGMSKEEAVADYLDDWGHPAYDILHLYRKYLEDHPHGYIDGSTDF